MDTIDGLGAAGGRLRGAAIAIGNFDGVHLGHLRLFEVVQRAARPRRAVAAALTFEPHPVRLLAPRLAPPLIAPLARRLELVAAAGIEVAVVQPFDRAFASLSPDAFTDLLLDERGGAGARDIVVGADFTYGKDRAGHVQGLRLACEERGARLHIVETVTLEGLVVSSTKVREFVLEGRVDSAARLLGRPFDLDGRVVKGDGRGRRLGFPTANLATENELVPGMGVYAVRVRRGLRGPALMGACNVGLNPTFRPEVAPAPAAPDRAPPTPVMIEVFIMDFAADLYGEPLRVEFIQRLRPERRFPSAQALAEQIKRDVEEARRVLG